MHRFKLIVTGRELISNELIPECWIYSISVLPKLQLKNVPVFLSKLQFIGVSRTNLKEKKPDFLLFYFAFSLKTRTPEERAESLLIIQKYQ